MADIEAAPEATEPQGATAEPQAEPDSFDRPYVEGLRKESAGYRERANTAEATADQLGRQLFLAKVKADGRMADPTDLPYNAEALGDDSKLDAAISDLLASKPHFASRTPGSPLPGQGVIEQAPPSFSITSALKSLV